jgi:hypothetical protein
MDDLVAAPTPGSGLPDALPSAPVRRRRRGLRIALGGLAALVIVGVPGGLALYSHLASGTGDVVDRMVPNDADVYATLYLDPSLSQKLNLQGLFGHFPALKSAGDLQSHIDQGMDTALKPEGLSFKNDVRPWLGTQVALAMRLGDGIPTAVLIASKDDGAAAATLARIRTTDSGHGDSWTEHAHNGVTVSVGTPRGTGGTPIAYAYVDHTAVVGNSAAMIESVIDTDQGKRAPLRTSAAYTTTMKRLPTDRVAAAWARGSGITGAMRQAVAGSGFGDASILKAFDQGAGVFQSAGIAVTAEKAGLAADVAVVTDPSKLPPAERAALLQTSGAPNPTLDWIPSDSAGFLAVGGLHDSLQSFVQGMGAGAAATGMDFITPLKSFGLTNPGGVLSHLTGNLALEVRDAGGSSIPSGALLAGVDNAAAVRSFLDQLVAGFAMFAPTHSESYRGATITSLAIPGLSDAGVDPAYTVVDGMAVIGSTPAEVRAVLDAHASGSRATATPAFAAGGQWSNAEPVIFLDLDRIRTAVVGALPGDLKQQYDRDLSGDLSHLHGLRITSTGGGDQVVGRIFLSAG